MRTFLPVALTSQFIQDQYEFIHRASEDRKVGERGEVTTITAMQPTRRRAKTGGVRARSEADGEADTGEDDTGEAPLVGNLADL